MAVSEEDEGKGDQRPQTTYEPGLVLASNEEVELTWKDRANCHGLHDLFDLEGDPKFTKEARRERRHDNKYKIRTARELCFACPVFEECWNDAYDHEDIGVIRAAALLDNEIRAVRIKRLVVAWDIYQRNKEKHGRRRRRTRGNGNRRGA